MKKLILVFGVFASSFSAVFIRLSTAPPLVMVLYRMGLAALLMTAYVLCCCREEVKRLSVRDVYPCVFSGFFLAVHFASYFTSLSSTSISASTFLSNMEIFFVVLGSFVILKQPISAKGWTGIAITFAGSVLIAGTALAGDGNAFVGDMLAFAAAGFMAVYTMLGTLCQRKLPTNIYTWIVYSSAALLTLGILLISGTPVFGYGKVNLLTAIGLAVGCTLMGHSIFSMSLQYFPAAYVSVVKLLGPVFALVQSVVIMKELPEASVVAGGFIVIGGIVYYSVHEKGLTIHGKAQPPQSSRIIN